MTYPRPAVLLAPEVQRLLTERQPFLWLNDHWLPMKQAQCVTRFDLSPVRAAEERFKEFAVLLKLLFPELEASGGIIESALHPADALQKAMSGKCVVLGRWFVKCDHALPVAGSIKARGGIYEVLSHAAALASREDLLNKNTDARALASPAARALFARRQVIVGSTGNLGLSIGIMAAALGFQAIVHMSSNAKEWKKVLLRKHGVEVIEHSGDFGVAVSAGRAQARQTSNAHFVDDEISAELFWGYSVAALRLKQQLASHGIQVDARHPLFVYLPCGVGGAPGGITFGLRYLFGDHVHCFFAEPIAAPCMLIRLASVNDRTSSVRDFGLDNLTEADGLAVGQASEFVAPLIKPLVSGVFTVPDRDLFEDLFLIEQVEGLRIEPSAAAGFRGPRWLLESEIGLQYVEEHHMSKCLDHATHVLWSTGGAFVPVEEYRQFHARGRVKLSL